jgi:hypothetical protein
MKLLTIEPDTVSLELSRAEFHGLRDALREAINQLEEGLVKRKELQPQLKSASDENAYDILYEGGFTEDSAEEFAKALKQEEALLEQTHALRSALEKITDEGELWRLLLPPRNDTKDMNSLCGPIANEAIKSLQEASGKLEQLAELTSLAGCRRRRRTTANKSYQKPNHENN